MASKGYMVTKTFPHELGLSCVYRQHKAKSHCNLLHGYALQFEITFTCDELTEEGWVIDFGDLRWIKRYLEETFDHTLVVAADDKVLLDHDWTEPSPIAKVTVLPKVGCEAFAQLVWTVVSNELSWRMPAVARGVKCTSVSCLEHGANKATYYRSADSQERKVAGEPLDD